MNEIQAIRANDQRRQRDKRSQAIKIIREIQPKLNRLYRKVPFCDICRSRLCDDPAGHRP